MDFEDRARRVLDKNLPEILRARGVNTLETLSDHDFEVLFFAKLKQTSLGEVIEASQRPAGQ